MSQKIYQKFLIKTKLIEYYEKEEDNYAAIQKEIDALRKEFLNNQKLMIDVQL